MAADRRKHEMTNRKMFFAMLWGAVFRRRSRAVMAVIASLVGAATLFCLASVCIAVPQQMNEEMRAYGANLIVTPADATSKSEGISTATITNVTALVTAEHSAKSASYRYESVRINSAPYTLAGVNPKAVQTLNRHWNVTGDWPSEGNVMVGRDVADALGVHIGSRITIGYRASDNSAASSASGLSDSGESDNQTGENGSQMSDSGESDANGTSGTKDAISLGDDGVIVSQSAASAMGVNAGDTVTLTNGNEVQADAYVSAVTRSVIGSDVYVSETYYHQLFDTAASGTSSASSASDSGESDNKNGKSGTSNGASSNNQQLVWNAMYANLKGSGESQTAYAEKLEDDDAIMKAVSCAHMAESFKFDLMGAVVALIVALAGGLALVVLFTLANTNVSEREREMATLKVLGFFDKEVHHYVNREMMVLTMMGVVLGLPLGRFVGGLLTAALNMPALYFEVECKPLSYVIAAVATMAFALLVQLLVNPVLDRIDPISSLKSVE